MCFTPDSYLAMILYEFPAFLTCTCDVWRLVRGVEGISRRVSRVIILFIAVQPPASDPSLNLVHSFLLCKLGKNL